MVYLPSGAPANDHAAEAALEWRNGPYPNKEFQMKWESIIREWSIRWGKKVEGWWFDGCYFPDSMYRSPTAPNFESFGAAARAGNASAAVAFNPGVVYRIRSMTPYEDYTAGELDKPDRVEVYRGAGGQLPGVQIQMLSYLGQTWGSGMAPRFSSGEVIAFSQKLWGVGGPSHGTCRCRGTGTLLSVFWINFQPWAKQRGRGKHGLCRCDVARQRLE